MLDTDNAQINCDSERQRDEDPTQPFNADAQPELRGAILHRFVIKLRGEESHKQHSQDLPTGCPRNVEHDRHEQMKKDATTETRTSKWPSLRDRKDERCEKRVEQPVAELEE